MTTKSPTNVYTYVFLLFVFIIFVTGIIEVGNEFLLNENANPDNDSIEYIRNLKGIDLSDTEVTSSEIEDPILLTDNSTQGNPKDFALEFQFTKEKGSNVETAIRIIFTTPEVILIDILRLNLNNWIWFIELLNWFWSISIVISLIYFARNNNT